MNTVIFNMNPELSSYTGRGNGGFSVVPDTANYTQAVIQRKVRVSREYGEPAFVIIKQLANPNSDLRDSNVFYPSSSQSNFTWKVDPAQRGSTYSNFGGTAHELNDNWRSGDSGSGSVQRGLGLTQNNPFVINMFKMDGASGQGYTRQFFVRSYSEDITNDNNQPMTWTMQTVVDSGTSITITRDYTSTNTDGARMTIVAPSDLQQQKIHMYKFVQDGTNLEFYVKVNIMANIVTPEPGGGDEPGGGEEPTITITSIACQDINIEKSEEVNLLSFLTVTPSEYNLTKDDIASVTFSGNFATYNSSTGKIIGANEGSGTILVQTTNGKTVTANITVTDPNSGQNTNPVKCLLVTYEWDVSDGVDEYAYIDLSLDTITYVYTGDRNYLTPGTTSSIHGIQSGHYDYASSEFYGLYTDAVNNPTFIGQSDGEYGPINSSRSLKWVSDPRDDRKVIQFGGKSRGGACKQQVLIILGDNDTDYGLVKKLNTQNAANFDEDIYIEMYANWSGTKTASDGHGNSTNDFSVLDHGGKDDARQLVGFIKNVTVQLFEGDSFFYGADMFQPQNMQPIITKKLEQVKDKFFIASADNLNSTDPMRYCSSLGRISYNTLTEELSDFTDLRTQVDDPSTGKVAGITPEFYAEANLTDANTFTSPGFGNEFSSVWGITPEGAEAYQRDSWACASDDTYGYREFIIRGIPMDQVKVPVTINSSIIKPDYTDSQYPVTFNEAQDLSQVGTHIAKGFTIKYAWWNECSQFIKVYKGSSQSDITSQNYLGQIGASDGIHINTTDEATDLIFDFSEMFEAYKVGHFQATPIRYSEVLIFQDDSPEIARITFYHAEQAFLDAGNEDSAYAGANYPTKRVIWPLPIDQSESATCANGENAQQRRYDNTDDFNFIEARSPYKQLANGVYFAYDKHFDKNVYLEPSTSSTEVQLKLSVLPESWCDMLTIPQATSQNIGTIESDPSNFAAVGTIYTPNGSYNYPICSEDRTGMEFWAARNLATKDIALYGYMAALIDKNLDQNDDPNPFLRRTEMYVVPKDDQSATPIKFNIAQSGYYTVKFVLSQHPDNQGAYGEATPTQTGWRNYNNPQMTFTTPVDDNNKPICLCYAIDHEGTTAYDEFTLQGWNKTQEQFNDFSTFNDTVRIRAEVSKFLDSGTPGNPETERLSHTDIVLTIPTYGDEPNTPNTAEFDTLHTATPPRDWCAFDNTSSSTTLTQGHTDSVVVAYEASTDYRTIMVPLRLTVNDGNTTFTSTFNIKLNINPDTVVPVSEL